MSACSARCRTIVALLAAGVFLSSTAAAPAFAEFAFLGPAPARNFQPLQLIFLNLPFERAAVLPAGRLQIGLDSAEINEIATTQGSIDSVLKFETNRTVVRVRYGIAPGWEAGMDLPFISRFGGFLDPFIDEVEGAFAAGNPERDMFSNNSFGAFTVRRRGRKIFDGNKETLVPGDLALSLKREFRAGEGWPRFALRSALKVPTGSPGKVTGSGKMDFGLGLAADWQVLPRLMLYLNLNVVYPIGPITPVHLTLNPFVSESLAAELAITERVSALLHQAVYTSPMHGTGVRLLDGTPVEIGLGLNFAWTHSVGFQLLLVDNVSPVEPAADFSLLLAMRLTPGA